MSRFRSDPDPDPARSILAVHGFTGSGADFAPLAERWPAPAEWHCPDLPGHGKSRIDGDATRCSAESTLADLRKVADAIARKPVLIGYSMGARAALHLVLEYPKPWNALILIGPNPGIEDADERRRRLAADTQLAASIRRDGTQHFLKRWRKVPLIASQRGIDPSVLKAMDARRERNRPGDLAASLEGFGAAACPPVWSRLAEVTCPTLLVAGERDERYRAIIRRMRDHMPNARTAIVPAAGHMAHLENPDAFVEIAGRFLAGSC